MRYMPPTKIFNKGPNNLDNTQLLNTSYPPGTFLGLWGKKNNNEEKRQQSILMGLTFQEEETDNNKHNIQVNYIAYEIMINPRGSKQGRVESLGMLDHGWEQGCNCQWCDQGINQWTVHSPSSKESSRILGREEEQSRKD